MTDAATAMHDTAMRQAEGRENPGQLHCRNIRVGTRRTSMRLEPLYWASLDDIAQREGEPLSAVLGTIDQRKAPNASLTAAVRAFVVAYYRALARDAD